MYGDILEFHRRALKFFNRPSEFILLFSPHCCFDNIVCYSLETIVPFILENVQDSISVHPQQFKPAQKFGGKPGKLGRVRTVEGSPNSCTEQL